MMKRFFTSSQGTKQVGSYLKQVRGFQTSTGFDKKNLHKAYQADVKHSEHLSKSAFENNNPQEGKRLAGVAVQQRDATFTGPKDREHTIRRNKVEALSKMTDVEAQTKYKGVLRDTKPGKFPPYSQWDGNVGRTHIDDLD